MISSRKFNVPAITALTCLIAVGCSGDNDKNYDPFARLQNKPPIIVKDSLTWAPAHSQVQRGVEYLYFVRAIDPDIGDKVIKYFWRFEGGEIRETDEPSVRYTFLSDAIGSVSVMASDRWVDGRWATGPEVPFTVPLSSNNSPNIILIPPVPSEVKAEEKQFLNFKIIDADNDNVFWTVNWGDGSVEDKGMVSNTSGEGAIVSPSHSFAKDLVDRPVTVTIVANDQKTSNTFSFEWRITN